MRIVYRPYQGRVLEGLRHGIDSTPAATFTVLFPRQAGKNHVSAGLVAALLIQNSVRGGSVIVCAPTFQPQAIISFERTLANLHRRKVEVRNAVRAEGHTITMQRARAIFLSASPEAHVAGHTASIVLVADEAQEIDPEWFDRQFRPMTASTAAPVVLFGTPWDGSSLLDRAVARNRSRHPERHFQVSWQEVAADIYGYGEFVLEERERLGPNSQVFRTQYELVPGQPENALFTSERLAAVLGDHQALDGPLPGERYVAGLDVGGDRAEADATVLTIGRVAGARLEVVAHVAWHGASFTTLAGDIRAIHARWGLAHLAIDATGMGAALASMLEQEPAVPVERFVFTAASKHVLGTSLVAAAESGRLAIYAGNGSREYQACIAELRDCRLQLRPGGLTGWGNDRAHDDYVASLALCLHAALAIPAPRVAVGRPR